MSENNILEELKDEILEKVKKNGFITTEDLDVKNRGLEKEEFVKFLEWLDEQKFDILTPSQAYLRKLPTVRAKISFCYYVFICHFLSKKSNPDDYKRNIVFKQRPLVDYYLSKELDDFEREIVRAKFGLDDGEPCWNEEELFKKQKNIPYLDAFIRYYAKAQKKLDLGYKNHHFLKNQLLSIEQISGIDHYTCDKVSFDDGPGIIFQPIKKEGEKDVGYIGGTMVYYSENDSMLIGWINEPYRFHQALIIDKDTWCFRFYNKNKPNPNIYYENGKLTFGFYYPGVGYHGRKYIFESGKNAIIEDYRKGTRISSTEIEFKIDTDFNNAFPLTKIQESTVETINLKNGIGYIAAETIDNHQAMFRVMKETGNCTIGQMNENGFNGTILDYKASSNEYVYQVCVNGELDKKAPRIIVKKDEFPQVVALFYYNKDNRKCAFFFDPDSSTTGLLFAEYDAEGKKQPILLTFQILSLKNRLLKN